VVRTLSLVGKAVGRNPMHGGSIPSESTRQLRMDGKSQALDIYRRSSNLRQLSFCRHSSMVEHSADNRAI
jgi:hypothetical protein